MAVFTFKAYNESGSIYQDCFEASSLPEAKKQLIDQGISLVDIQQKKRAFPLKVPLSSVLNFTSELSQLLEAGLPLFESLTLLKKQGGQDPILDTLYQISDALEEGSSFSEALLKFPKCFSPLYCSLVQAGEQSGHLDLALKKIMIDYERQNKLKKKVQSALLYPAILLSFCFILIHLMILYIIPSLEDLFAENKGHLFTQGMIALSHHLKQWEWLYILILGSFFGLLRWKLKSKALKPFLDLFLLKLPLVKSLILDLNLSKFSSTMALLLKGGIPLLESLSLSKKLLSNHYLQSILSGIEKKIESGHTLSLELKKHPIFPPLFGLILSTGENAGELPKSFEKLAALYEERVDKKLSKFMTLLSPIILLIMGVIIGAVMLGILIPLTDIHSIAI